MTKGHRKLPTAAAAMLLLKTKIKLTVEYYKLTNNFNIKHLSYFAEYCERAYKKSSIYECSTAQNTIFLKSFSREMKKESCEYKQPKYLACFILHTTFHYYYYYYYYESVAVEKNRIKAKKIRKKLNKA